MADVLIFSRERPCQLDLLLRSIERHAHYDHVYVLWRADSDIAADGYAQLRAEFRGWVYFMHEQNFEQDVRYWLAVAGDVVSFLVDDDVFYRDAHRFIAVGQSEFSFVDGDYPNRFIAVGDLPFSYRGGDYDYPLSVDGNLYRRQDIEAVLDAMPMGWSDPTQLEALMHEFRHVVPFDRVQYGTPSLTGVPANRVSPSSGMPHLGVDLDKLNRGFLAGARIDLDSVEEQILALPPAAHTAVHYEWETN